MPTKNPTDISVNAMAIATSSRFGPKLRGAELLDFLCSAIVLR
jgi:hypothetical protein